jgi:hypothetical protein
MPKIDIDELVEKLLEHSDKYPELETYAAGLKEIYRQSKEDDKKSKPLTDKKKNTTIHQSSPVKGATIKDLLSELGVGV